MKKNLDQITYQGNDLGVSYTKQSTQFKVWAPTAQTVFVNLYEKGNDSECIQSIPMQCVEDGIWSVALQGDYDGIYYTYLVNVNGTIREVVDPYAKSAGVNGQRGMILDLTRTDPEGFEREERPELTNSTDAIIYELHIRDFSSSKDSGSRYPGKYLAFTEEKTKNHEGQDTLMEFLKGLGVTHIHLLPAFDYATIDESGNLDQQYNWGYDPQNYNVPEGSYSTNPYDGAVRVKEFKQMVQALHKNGLRVIMDMVYNHTYFTEDSNFNQIVPDYYYRKVDGEFSNASACGNETASEHPMMRKFMVDSIIYWAREYHIDGFRFDLMGVHDIETMNAIRKALDEIDPGILMYGEGWTGGTSPLDESLRAMKCNMDRMPGIGAFCDDMRDAIKGSVFEEKGKGFVNGGTLVEQEDASIDAASIIESIKFGIVAATNHPQIDESNVNYSKRAWAVNPAQCINYASAHDNLTLWDKICTTNPEDSYETRVAMNKLAAAIILTSQGIPFFQAGEEMLRTKPSLTNPGEFDENSYRSTDAVNSIKWEMEASVCDVINYYKGLIEFRKAHPCLYYKTAKEIQENLKFLDGVGDNVIVYTVGANNNDLLCIIFNANPASVKVTLPEKEWKVYVDGDHAGTQVLNELHSNEVMVEARSALVLAHA